MTAEFKCVAVLRGSGEEIVPPRPPCCLGPSQEGWSPLAASVTRF